MDNQKNFILSIDIGGTFTDLVLLERFSGAIFVAKVLTQYPDPSAGVLDGVRQILDMAKMMPAHIGRVIHGTTLVTNTLIERKGAKTGLITTAGFRDALEIGREGRYDIYDLFLKLPKPLVERRLRFEVRERLYARGEVMIPLVEADVEAVCKSLQTEQVEAVAIVFLHAYVNPEHEKRAAEIVRHYLPNVSLSISHEVAAELREFERTSTTVANAYVQPLASQYLRRLEGELRDLGIVAPFHIMLSNRGSCAVETAAQFPIRLVESGPCGGALAAAHCGKLTGREKILAFDMGGTTAKAVMSDNGDFPITTESEVARVYRFKRGSGLPLLVPVLDMIEIGAGGGSVAHLNELNLPVVGPESAGSEPGPACYDRGGQNPTVTDADLLLGYLNPDYFLGGKMLLNLNLAEKAVTGLSGKMGMDRVQAALGIHNLVNENMANAARVHAAERGLDLEGYALVATGGAGPVHACGVAKRLRLKTVIVPPIAGVGSAFGLMLAPIAFDFARSLPTGLDGLDVDRLNGLFEEMEQDGHVVVTKAGVKKRELTVTRTADMRYAGQGHEIRVPVPNGILTAESRRVLQAAFDAEYQRLYGRICPGVAVQAIHWRVTVSGPRPENLKASASMRHNREAKKGTRPVVFDNEMGFVEVPVYDRYAIAEKFSAHGPVVIEEAESTTLVPPGWTVVADGLGHLILTHGGANG